MVSDGFQSGWFSTAGRRLTLVTALAACVLGAVGTQYYRVEAKIAGFETRALETAEVFYLPPKPVLRVMSLGHESFLADMMFMRVHAYFLRHLFADRIFDWLDTYLEAIIYLEPDNPRIYGWASRVAKYGQLITNESVDKSNEYARMGASLFPNDWRFYMDIGFNLYFEYKYADDEEKKRLQDEALEYFTMAASLPNSQLDPNFITELYTRRNDTKMALFQAYRAYHEASATERRYLLRRIRQLSSAEEAEALALEERRWRDRYRFLPLGVFRLIGGMEDTGLPKDWHGIAEVHRAE